MFNLAQLKVICGGDMLTLFFSVCERELMAFISPGSLSCPE